MPCFSISFLVRHLCAAHDTEQALELAVKAYGEYVSIRPHDAGAYFHYGRACYDLSVYFVGVGTFSASPLSSTFFLIWFSLKCKRGRV